MANSTDIMKAAAATQLALESTGTAELRRALGASNLFAEYNRAMGTSNIINEIRALTSVRANMLRAYKSPFEDFRTGIGEITATAARFGELLNQMDAFDRRFSLPIQAQMEAISASFSAISSFKSLGLSAARIAAIESSMLALRKPWLDIENNIGSIAAVSELHALAAGLADRPPFDGSLTAILRQDLGDWRKITEFPKSVLTDPIERFHFYRELGFDDALTNFTEPAFGEILDTAGLRNPDLPAPVTRYGGGLLVIPDDTDSDVPATNQESYAQIFRLETNLRRFIDELMTACFGDDWAKHQTPAGMYGGWKAKAKTARDNGEQPQPLINHADFSDYILIIERNDNWKQVFQPVFGRKADIQESLIRLGPVRICTMHARVVTSDDHLIILVEARRILKALESHF